MTVAGIGIDVVDVRSFAEQLEVAGTTMLDHYTPAARELRNPNGVEHEHLAVRWAAKEAFVKAWSGTRHGAAPQLAAIDLREIEVVRDAWGRPSLRLHGRVEAAVAEEIGPCHLHLSLSHDGDMAAAFVVIDR